jgi:hypothetical protein
MMLLPGTTLKLAQVIDDGFVEDLTIFAVAPSKEKTELAKRRVLSG